MFVPFLFSPFTRMANRCQLLSLGSGCPASCEKGSEALTGFTRTVLGLIAVFVVNSVFQVMVCAPVLHHLVDRSSLVMMPHKPKAMASPAMLTGVSPVQASFLSFGSSCLWAPIRSL